MYFSRGNLPWQERYLGGGKGGTKEDKYRRILDKKDCPSTCAMSIHQTNLQQTKESTLFLFPFDNGYWIQFFCKIANFDCPQCRLQRGNLLKNVI